MDIFKSALLVHDDIRGSCPIFINREVFYNRKCRHESLGNVSPVVYEEMYEMKQERAA